MTLLLVMLFMLAAVAMAVGYPLWRPRTAAALTEEAPPDDLLTQKESTYSALKELEFDYALGNLNPQDHQDLEEKYKSRAVSILKQLDARQQAGARQRPAEEEIEVEILRLRRPAKAPRPGGAEDVEAEIMKLRRRPQATRPAPSETCPHCGAGLAAGAKYCPRCGSPIAPLVCPQCQAPYHKGDRFCSQCGTSLPGGN